MAAQSRTPITEAAFRAFLEASGFAYTSCAFVQDTVGEIGPNGSKRYRHEGEAAIIIGYRNEPPAPQQPALTAARKDEV